MGRTQKKTRKPVTRRAGEVEDTQKERTVTIINDERAHAQENSDDLDLPDFLRRTPAPVAEPTVEVEVESEVEVEQPRDLLPALPTASTVSTDDLTILADRIKAAHAAVGTALQHALDAGCALLKAKRLVPHGGWLPWIEDHCGISVRTAQAYMRLANEDEQLIAPDEDQIRSSVAHLSVRAAVKKVAKPKPTKKAKTKPAAIDVVVSNNTGVTDDVEFITDIADVKVVTEVAEVVTVVIADDDPVVEDFCQQWARSKLKQLFESATDDQRAAILAFVNRK
jgi:hypothetical protein